MTSERITSPANPQIKQLVRLRNRRHRDETGLFVIEGFRELTRANHAGVAIDTLYVAPDLWIGSNETALVGEIELNGARIVEVDPAPFTKASYRDRPEGLLATARHLDTSLSSLELSERALVLVAEAIEKPGNLGTMLRTAEAAGVDAVVVADPTTDPFNPNVVRASLGALFTVPLGVAATSEVVDWCRDEALTVVAATPEGAVDHFAVDLTGPTAIVVGSEQYGLSSDWMEAADRRAVITMPGTMDSLNAAMSAGILLFEAVRQRRSGGHSTP